MDHDLKSITNKLKEAFEKLINLPNNMTSLQKETEKEKIWGLIASYGVSCEHVGNHFEIKFYNHTISDKGVIEDVVSGSFPIHLKIDDGIFVFYEPRHFLETYEGVLLPDNLDNSIYNNLQIGSAYQFSGKIVRAHYNYKRFIRDGKYFQFNIMSTSPKTKYQYQNKDCFIATACYNDIDAIEVKILRNYRDKKLVNNLFGLLFVKFYYILSPAISKLISRSENTKYLIRKCILNPIVTIIK